MCVCVCARVYVCEREICKPIVCSSFLYELKLSSLYTVKLFQVLLFKTNNSIKTKKEKEYSIMIMIEYWLNLCITTISAQSARAVEYINCISAEW